MMSAELCKQAFEGFVSLLRRVRVLSAEFLESTQSVRQERFVANQ